MALVGSGCHCEEASAPFRCKNGAVFGAAAAAVGTLAALVSENAWIASVSAILVAAALAWWSLRAAAPLRHVHRLGSMLDHAESRAREALLAIAAEAPRDAVGQSIVVSVATVLSNGRCHGDARRLLEGLPTEGLSAHERELRDLALLAAMVHTRDLAAARASLANVSRIAPGSLHALAARRIEALLLVHEGRVDDALGLVADEVADPDGERSRRVVLAHVYAAKADERAVAAQLTWLEQHHGRAALERVVEPEGPASAAAWSRLEGGTAPYRR